MKTVKYLIIGGGISGLTFAGSCGSDYIVAEKEDVPGGFCRTTKKDGFVWDFAGHFFHFKTERFKEFFKTHVPDDDIIRKDKCTKIVYKDRLIDYPFQKNIHQLEKEEFIDCLYDLFNKEEKESYDSFLDMLYGKFGVSITEKFLRPYNEKLYAVDLTRLDKDAMGRFFPYADREDIIKNMKRGAKDSSYNEKFLYPKNGAGSFIDILYSMCDSSSFLFGTEVVSVDADSKVCRLSNGNEIKYEYLINTSPLNRFLPLINEKPLTSFSESLSYNKVLVFNLGFNKKSTFTNEHWLYIPDKSINFYRIGFYDNILDSDRLSMYIEIGYGKDGIVNEKEQLDATLHNLKRLGIIDDTFELVASETIVMDPAYVHISAESERDVPKVMKYLSERGIYSIGRYGAWTYCSMEDSMIAASELAERLESLR